MRRSGKGIFRGGSGRPCGAVFQFWARSKNCMRFAFKLRALPFSTACARIFCSVRTQFQGEATGNTCTNKRGNYSLTPPHAEGMIE